MIKAFGPPKDVERGVRKMTFLSYLRRFIKKGGPKPTMEYVQETPGQAPAIPPHAGESSASWDMDSEIDLSARSDLEDYARGLSVPKESIERWISSGLLMPEELKVAEKLVKIMRKH
jgi:hypothetical protein